ncbi:hypothetical protein [Methanobacterium sp. 42_16]|uniref:beta strand repeat-containing protein n=1 Tax=Methanobacterium sp. 42_16 TaxID=1641383 RepID=UPI0007492799|nr:hypothetical protein [Methanobacterium sp. 42_16]KUK73389.1 MAG: Uncharacterized protein XD90_1552 [Methanobacterium sp. 42_16]
METNSKTSHNQIILFSLCILLIVVSMSALETSSAASTLYVNNATGNDDWDGTSATYQGGTVGPKATIQNATDTVDPEGTVNVASGTYYENLQITRNLSLQGENRETTIIDGSGSDRVINVDALNFLIAHFTIQNGLVTDAGAGIYKTSGTTTINDCTIKDNTVQAITGGWGGGIYNQEGQLNIQNSLLTNNRVLTATDGGWGGALYNLDTVNIINTQFNDNNVTAAQDSAGGAIYNANQLDITDSVFNQNSAQAADQGGNGGAIYNHNNGVITLTRTDFFDNLAQSLGDNALGGAIYSFPGGTVNIDDCCFECNQALAAEDGGMGGAIFNQEGTFTITSSAFTENRAYCDLEGGIGGAIFNLAGILTITDAIFTTNLAQANEMGGVAGAIANIGGNVTLTDITFSENTAQGETIAGAAGAILNLGMSLTYTEIISGGIEVITGVTPVETHMDIVNCDFDSNQALATTMGGLAGAIANIYSNLSLTGGTFTGNLAQVTEDMGGVAGALANILGNVTITDTAFFGNTAEATEIGGVAGAILNVGLDFTLLEGLISEDIQLGGIDLQDALENADTNLVINNCDFNQNQALATRIGGIAGAIGNIALGNTASTFSITGSTFTGNLAQVTEDMGGVAGALANIGGDVTLTDNTFTENVAQAAEIGGVAGAILNVGLSGLGLLGEVEIPANTMTIVNCDFNSNQALSTSKGAIAGAIANINSQLLVTGSTLTNNQAQVTEDIGGVAGALANILGTVTLTDTTFSGNVAEATEIGGVAGAILNLGVDFTLLEGILADSSSLEFLEGIGNIDTSMVINNCNFDQNQALATTIGGLAGAIGNVGMGETVTNLSITGSTFTGNRAQTETEGGLAGAIGNYGGIVTITSSLLENNIARADEEGTNIPTGKGGAIYNQKQLTVTGSTIKGNQAIVTNGNGQGGGIYNDGGTFQVNFNRIVENAPEDLYNSIEESQFQSLGAAGEGSPYNAQYNWWGANSDPYLRGRIVGEQVAYGPWMVLRLAANPVTITAGVTSTLTADLRYDNQGNFHDPAYGHIPDNTLVTFTTNLGNVGSKSVTVPMVNGLALAILRADEGAGLAWLTARLDSELLTLAMTINPAVVSASTTKTIGMQETGQPLLPAILAGLMVLGGIILPRRIK